MHKELAVALQSNRVPVPTDRIQLLPLSSLRVVGFDQVDGLFRIVCSSAHDNKLAAHKAD